MSPAFATDPEQNWCDLAGNRRGSADFASVTRHLAIPRYSTGLLTSCCASTIKRIGPICWRDGNPEILPSETCADDGLKFER